MTMLMVSGDPAVTLKDVRLPAGTKVAIVSSSPDAVKKVQRIGKKRFGRLRTVYAGVPKATVINQDAFEPDARSMAILEGVRISQEDLRAAGGAYDLEQVQTLLRGISRQAVDKRVQEGSLLAVPGPSNRRSFPTLQFNRDGTIVDGLKFVQAAIPTRNPWAMLNFLVHPDDRLKGRKPIDLLKDGKIEMVVEAARRIGQQGA
ncbi:hypothetical protein [Mesorhizobium sp. M0243]|uniref:hypothetical protein n=1 Tax=Mesorhizobium sp. M0243 TaxID=2956925 RepID=UPI003338CD27